MAYTNKNVGDKFGCHITETSTFNSPNYQYLKIFGFNQIDFVCFEDKQNAGFGHKQNTGLGEWGTVQIASWKCNFGIYLDI